MKENLTVLFGLLGGLALFLYGMNSMSEALQKAAGEKMKKILGFLTKNPIMGALAGALVTAILQSSSATTVMVIGFVSAGLMGLPQAISVIFGANIGTTMTAQLIAFKISDYIFPIIFIGFIVNFLSKKEKIKSIGMVVFSFGLLFEGIEIMSSVMKPLASSPVFTDLMAKVSDIPILGILLGLTMTLVVQSSSATIAVLQSFASQAGANGVTSIIGLTGAIPILLGDNIGTTITALLASIGQSRNAKRTAVAHSVFNISGSIVFAFFISQFATFIRFISPKGAEVDVISRQIANAHTFFNVTCTLVWLPLIPIMVKIVKFLIPEAKPSAVSTHAIRTSFLDDRMLNQPTAALFLVSEEIEHLSGNIILLIEKMSFALTGKAALPTKKNTDGEKSSRLSVKAAAKSRKNPQPSSEHSEITASFEQLYSECKFVQTSIINYISEMFSSGSLSQEQSEEASGLLAVINDMDRLTDRCHDIVSSAASVAQGGKTFSSDAQDELNECMQAAEKMFRYSFSMLHNNSIGDPSKIAKARKKMRRSVRQFSKAHLARVRAGKCSESMTKIYSEMLYNLDRIGDNCVGIFEEALDNVKLIDKESMGIS